jgi:ketosteroid isomerase-like protein
VATNNQQIIRRLAAAFNERDAEAMIADLDPAAELYPLRAQLEGKAYRGHDGAREMLADLTEDWESMTIEIDELRDAVDDQVVALCHLRSRGRASRMDLNVPMAFLWRLRDGKVVYGKTFSEQAEALRAAGLE